MMRARNDFVGLLGPLAILAVLLLSLGPVSTQGLQGQETGTRQGDRVERSDRSGPVEPHPEAERAISRLKSPFCPGLMLEVCPSPQATALRDTIQMMAEEGADADSLVTWMLARHGEEYRAMPQTEGKGILAWVIPPLAILLGGGLVVVALRRLRGSGDGRIDEEAIGNLSSEDEERLSEALSQMEREGH